MAQYDKAEQYYKKCLEIAKNLTKLDQLILYIPIAKLYIQTKQFDKAKYYVDALSTSESKKMEPLYVQRDVELMHFQTDSAFGNYTQAIAHLQLYKALNDSIFNDTKSKQLEELKVKYETDKKNKDIELLTKQSLLQASQLKQERLQFEFENEKKKHDLELLTFEADKKDKDLKLVQLETEKKNTEINLLQKNKEITEQQLSKESLTKKFLISAIICLILLSVVIVRVVMLKRKNEKHRHELAENESKIQQLENKKQFAEFEMQAQAAQIKAMVATQEQERKRISRDLHDDVGTKLSALNLYLSSLSEKATVINNDEIKSLAQSSKQFIKEAMHDVRELLFNLSPTVLEEFGYTTAVEGLVNKINETKQIHFDLVVFGINHRLKKDYELTLYRITQELINNVLKHAEAKHVSLQIGQRDEKIILMMEDDGIGFDVKAHQNGYGLHNLDARTKLMKGTMHIDSQPGKGTSVLVEIPYNYNGV